MNIIILAGGRGTRFWPISRDSKPKQFTPIIEKRTMLECTFDRFKSDYPKEDIYISTTPEFKDEVIKILPQISWENIIVEPEKRDTAAAMGFVAAKLSINEPDEPMVFIPSDHYIANEKKFIESLKTAEKIIKEKGKMMDIAITPNFPSTALGYTKIGDKFKDVDGIEIFNFQEHVEKPDFNTAKKYVSEGNYLWHANFYMWTPKKFLEAYKNYAPDIYRHLENIIKGLKENNDYYVESEYEKMRKISFDYAITENMKPENVLIIKGSFGWSDIGAWDVLYDQLQKEADENGNVIRGEWIGEDTTKSLIYGKEKKIIATIGLDDMVVVDTEDALLICPQGRSQDVKQLVKMLKDQKKKQYL
jgi:mannose-1-phosphate guanylyltransferase